MLNVSTNDVVWYGQSKGQVSSVDLTDYPIEVYFPEHNIFARFSLRGLMKDAQAQETELMLTQHPPIPNAKGTSKTTQKAVEIIRTEYGPMFSIVRGGKAA